MAISGMWQVAEGKRVEYAEDIYTVDVQDEGKKLRLNCPTKQIRSRGDTLNTATLTIVCHDELHGSYFLCYTFY